MIVVDVRCPACGSVEEDFLWDRRELLPTCDACGVRTVRLWTLGRGVGTQDDSTVNGQTITCDGLTFRSRSDLKAYHKDLSDRLDVECGPVPNLRAQNQVKSDEWKQRALDRGWDRQAALDAKERKLRRQGLPVDQVKSILRMSR